MEWQSTLFNIQTVPSAAAFLAVLMLYRGTLERRTATPHLQSNAWMPHIDVRAFELPLRKLPDLRYAHVFVEMLQHIDHSLQQVGHLAVLPLSGHGPATRSNKNAIVSAFRSYVLIAENRPPSLKTGHKIKKKKMIKALCGWHCTFLFALHPLILKWNAHPFNL